MPPTPWQPVLDDVWRFRDACNVYAVRGPEGVLIIDAGTGAWVEHVSALPAKPQAVLLTHYFRDHSAGANRAGVPVYVPEYEHAIVTDPQEHFRQRQTYLIYDNVWDLHAPIEPIDGALPFDDYATQTLAGLRVEAVPLPGATFSQTGYAVTLASGEQVVFCGETIHSPGRIPRIAPLQYDYNNFPGVVNVIYSIHRLRERWHDAPFAALLPSLGEPITADVPGALDALEANLRDVLEVFGRELYGQLANLDRPPLQRVTEHVYLSNHGGAKAWFLLNEDKSRAMVIDYGYDHMRLARAGYSFPERRRALLHGLDGLRDQFGIERIDVALISHFHDDHVAGVPVLQRRFGTECWACDNFADLLERPEAHCFPCNWPKRIRVDRRIGLDERVRWAQYEFHFAPMSGHTRFAALIGFEVDGKRFAHTGDQVFFRGVIDATQPERFLHNHVYRNGALIDGMAQTRDWLVQWRPDIVLTGHSDAIPTGDWFFKSVEAGAREYEQVHRRVMPLADDAAHFNVDSWGGWIWPYRVHLREPGPATVRVTVRNPYPRRATLVVRLVGPTGWRGTSETLEAAPRAEEGCDLQITPGGSCRRQPFALELVADGQPFGQVAEALMTAGGERF